MRWVWASSRAAPHRACNNSNAWARPMGQSSKSRASSPATGAPEAPQSPIPRVHPRELSAIPEPATKKPSALAGLDVAGHLDLLREAFEHRSRPAEPDADPKLGWIS